MTKEDKKLTGPQQKAINLFLAGMNDTEVADSLGVARQTVNKWKNQNLRFGAELDRQQQQLNQENHRQLSGLVSRSVQVLRQSLESENERVRQSTAIHVLKATGFYGADWRVQQLGNSMDEDETEIERLVEQFQMVGAQISGV